MASTELRRASGVPLHRQIADILRVEIQSGNYDASKPMTEAQLGARFGVSLAPVRQALAELAREGLIHRQQGKGTFPASGLTVDRPADLKPGDLYRYLADRGLHPTSQVSGIERIVPPQDVANKLALPAGEDVLHFTRLILVDESPLSINDIYIRSPHDFQPSEAELADGGSALQLLEQNFGIRVYRAEHEAWAKSATRELAKLLHVTPNSPLLVVDTLFYQADGTSIGWRSAIHRPEEFKFHFVSN